MGSPPVLILPIVEWEFRNQRPHHLARCFARAGDRVYYPALRLHPAPPPPEPVESGIWRIALRGDPGLDPYRARLSAAGVETALASLREIAGSHPLDGCWVVAQLPFWRPLAEAARAAFGGALLFDCMDDFSSFAAHGDLADEESALAAAADLVAVPSPRLLAKLSPHNPRTLLVPNACEPDHFGPVCARPPAGERPVAGFFGGIDEWFDAPLVEALARLRPGWDFWLIGHAEGAQLEPLRALSNVFFLGEMPYAELPRLMSRFDVGMIPFRVTPLTEAADTVKAYEMLAAGLPVVGSDLPQLRRLAPLVAVASTPGELAARLDEALADPPGARARRREAVLRHSWVERFLALRRAMEGAAPALPSSRRAGPPAWEALGLTERRWNRADLLRRVEQLGAESAAHRAECSRLAGQVGTLAAERDSLCEQRDRVQAEAERLSRELWRVEGERAGLERRLQGIASSRWWRLGERLRALLGR